MELNVVNAYKKAGIFVSTHVSLNLETRRDEKIVVGGGGNAL